MPLDIQTFAVHDISGFPIILTRPEAIVPGYAEAWEREMDMLLAEGRPFIVVFPTTGAEEGHEDRKRRGLWLKANKQALAHLCLSLITIEPDGLKRIALKAQTAMATKAFGIPAQITSSLDEAARLAKQLLSSGKPSE